MAKTESFSNPLPHSLLVRSVSDFAAGLEEDLLLCPVCALRIYLQRTDSFSSRPRRLFVSPCRPSHSLSKNVVSFFLREVIHEADAARPEVGSFRAHSIRDVLTSAAFHHNWSVSSVLESVTWRANSVFASFFLHDLQHEFNKIRSLGPFVAADERISYISPLPAFCWGGGEPSGPFFCVPCGSASLFGASNGAYPADA